MSPDPTSETPLTRIPFSPRAESSIRALATWMHIAGVVSMLGAVVRVVLAFTPRHDPSQLVGAVITFLLGLWTYQAASAFGQVAATDAADQRFLMRGFTLLRRVYLLQAILVIVMLALLVVGLTVAALFFTARAGAAR